MYEKIKDVVREIKSSVIELKDSRSFNTLVNMVGEDGAIRAIRPKLQQLGISDEQYKNYIEVRKKVHSSPLNIKENIKEIKFHCNNAIKELLS